MTDADKARAIQEQAGRLAATLEKHGWRKGAQFEYLQLCNAIVDLIDDGDALAERGKLQEELRCDENGDPVDEYGFPVAQFNPSLVHPDDPCQRKGFGV
jgi:hypothetical protein